MPKKNLGKFMSREDAKKILDRKERIQHPHMIKSRSHWDWDMTSKKNPITMKKTIIRLSGFLSRKLGISPRQKEELATFRETAILSGLNRL